MQFLPKKEERYFAAMRLAVQKFILKHGITEKSVLQLKKIYLAEALFEKDTDPTNLHTFSDALLGAAFLLLLQSGIHLSLHFHLKGIFDLHRRAFAALLLLIAKNAYNDCDICLQNTDTLLKIEVFDVKPFPEFYTLIKKLNGFYFKALGKGRFIILLPIKQTDGIPLTDENEWHYITDRFSPVNIYLERHTPLL